MVRLVRSFSDSSASESRQTALYDFHKAHGAKTGPFAGWDMPLQYGSVGVAASHAHTRTAASLFDVSHMSQWELVGRDAPAALERLCVADVKGLAPDRGTLSVFTNEKGGIIDDFIVNRVGDSQMRLYVVSNAGNAEKDRTHVEAWINEFSSHGNDVTLKPLDDFSLVALQGPRSKDVLSSGTTYPVDSVAFMGGFTTKLFNMDKECRVTRCGYTGEDGFEISVPTTSVVELAEHLLAACNNVVQLAGLGARDSLRLEAGLCLYGNDIDDDTTPVEAGLTWCIAKPRRAAADFIGANIILQQLTNKPTRRRVGIVSTGPVARGGAAVLSTDGEEVGSITSGCPGPTLKKNVAMAYVKSPFAKSGTAVKLRVRNREIDAVVTKMPFVPTNYYSPKKSMS